MAAKPGSTPRWANVGGAIVVPSSGKQDVGWEAPEKPPAEYFNWFQNLTWQWLDYLDEGILSGPHTFTGGDVTVEDDLLVDNNVIAATLSHTGQQERHASAQTGQIVSGVNDGTSWGDTLGQWLGAVGEVLQIPLVMRQKDRLHSVSARVLDAEQIEMRIWRVDATTGSITRTQVGATQTSVGGGVPETMTISGLAEDVGTGLITHYVEFTVIDDAGTSSDAQVFGVIYNVSHPTP